jgi:hypothetical protein
MDDEEARAPVDIGEIRWTQGVMNGLATGDAPPNPSPRIRRA